MICRAATGLQWNVPYLSFVTKVEPTFNVTSLEPMLETTCCTLTSDTGQLVTSRDLLETQTSSISKYGNMETKYLSDFMWPSHFRAESRTLGQVARPRYSSCKQQLVKHWILQSEICRKWRNKQLHSFHLTHLRTAPELKPPKLW